MFALAGILALTSVAIIAIPVFLIMPFKPQPAWAVTLGYSLERAGPVVTLLAGLAIIGLVTQGWRSGRWGWIRRGAGVLFVLAGAGTFWLARQNRFEWMFAPLPDPAFARPAQVDWMEQDDIVLAVNLNGEAAAYPRRQVAYHHLVGDSVGGIPIIATY